MYESLVRVTRKAIWVRNFFFPFQNYFNYRIITLQYWGGFCNSSTWIGRGYTYVPQPEPPSHLFPHCMPLGCHRAPALGSLHHISSSLLGIYFTYGKVYVSVLFSQVVPLSSFLTVSKSLFSMSAPPLRPCKWGHGYYLSRFHKYVLIYDICLSLSDFLHSA